ncbi:MAG: DUF2752 domain-containing protein [Clostridiales bacterium]|nr:DUF2752 domain-containing protein [Clostridiales bacterium]
MKSNKGRYARVLLKIGLGILVGAYGLAFGCPFYRFLRISCPCCGLTRAWRCFLNGEVRLAFSFHPLFLFIPILGVVYAFEEFLPLSQRLKNSFFCVAGILIFTVYIVRVAFIKIL